MEETMEKNSALPLYQLGQINKLTKEVNVKEAAINSKDEQLQQQNKIIQQQLAKLEKLQDETDIVKGKVKHIWIWLTNANLQKTETWQDCWDEESIGNTTTKPGLTSIKKYKP